MKAKLYKEVAKIRYPRRKEHQPFVFNDLNPYTETRLADNLVASVIFLFIGYFIFVSEVKRKLTFFI